MGYTRDMVSMQGLGYKEILDYLNGECSLDEAVYIIKRDTRHFAKRQITWFKRERDVRWLNLEAFGNDRERMLKAVLDDCRRTFPHRQIRSADRKNADRKNEEGTEQDKGKIE